MCLKVRGHVDPEILKLDTHIADTASHAAMQKFARYVSVSQEKEG